MVSVAGHEKWRRIGDAHDKGGVKTPPLSSLADALRIVFEFTRTGEQEISVATLSRRLGVPKSKVSRVLATFREAGWLEQDARTRAYKVGLKAYAVGARYLSGNTLAREAQMILRNVVDRSGCSSSLCILDGLDPFYLTGIEGPVTVDFGSRVGAYFPLHATAPGRILLAFSDSATIDRILKEPRMTAFPTCVPWNNREIRSDIACLREIGFAVSHGDRIPGVGGIGVPVFGAGQVLAAALSISYPISMVPIAREPYFAAILFDAARALSRRLGARLYPFGDGVDGREGGQRDGTPATAVVAG